MASRQATVGSHPARLRSRSMERMGPSKLLVSLVALALAAGTAAAQPARWARLSLADGRSVDGQITGGDAAHYFVQTPHGYFSIPRATVVAVTPLGQPAAAHAPSQPPPPPPAMGPTAEGGPIVSKRTAGLSVFVGTYLLTASIAAARVDDDDDAKTGLIPVLGPVVWATRNDDDKFGSDGWDYLAMMSTGIQVLGLFQVLTGKGAAKTGVNISAISTKDYGGFAVSGGF
jgi:hypothetical protein